jgi:hypothetical protein
MVRKTIRLTFKDDPNNQMVDTIEPPEDGDFNDDDIMETGSNYRSFTFERKKNSPVWVLIQASMRGYISTVTDNNDDFAESILNELNNGVNDYSATMLEIPGFNLRGNVYPGYTYESRGGPILKGGILKRKKSKQIASKNNRKSKREIRKRRSKRTNKRKY